ncbi:unsaturated rhamnogalacturonyl hydrolase [Clostridium sp. USBA 49]|uniref:glycoside hydrolase family 88/105 protein n=1 Tax=Clostridium sp. USBA 49 TaxID=1881060 RepID=UPI00099A24D5|nr:glycoside hydrolase family 88 protein [Clostridium sp. USBA 49]SKA73725.1 unsaturated rhamnogalacturonyl hydrolase [Clostridium sp. USBA 49]
MIEEFIDAYIENYKNYKENWNYEDGCVLKGALDLYKITQEEKYKSFILKYMNLYIDKDGNIKGYNFKNYNLDDINSGKVLFDLYEMTKDEKYKKAIEHLYKQVKEQPRTDEGNFWHKNIYPYQVWLDGLYMVMPFYIKYINEFGDKKNILDIYSQFINVQKHMRNVKNGLYYHGYDEKRQELWADKETGVSPNFWGRAEGWFVMALVDVIEEMDEEFFQQYEELKNMFKEAIDALLKYQDIETGMWYQILDKGGKQGNYVETSATCMIAYSILKGSRLGYLPLSYKDYGIKAFNGTLKKYFIKLEGKYSLGGICSVAGLGNNPYRDGSYEYYISEKVVSNDPKGVGAFLMVYGEMLRLK